jgi:cysteine synthase
MLRLRSLPAAGSAEVFVKLEYLNPGGSVKDRAAIGIIAAAEREGTLRAGGVVVEATAGNTGIGLALIGISRGYEVALFVPENFSDEKVTIMRALGAQVTRTPEADGMQGAIDQARAFASVTPGAFMAAQFENPANPEFHYETTAQEIFDQMKGQIDAITWLKLKVPSSGAGRRESTRWRASDPVSFQETSIAPFVTRFSWSTMKMRSAPWQS